LKIVRLSTMAAPPQSKIYLLEKLLLKKMHHCAAGPLASPLVRFGLGG
jgi:hypothetical protein